MIALSAPERMRSGWARAPMTRRMASTTMDFPAPVSPVTALSPGAEGHRHFLDHREIPEP